MAIDTEGAEYGWKDNQEDEADRMNEQGSETDGKY